jgi:hypothetical protein
MIVYNARDTRNRQRAVQQTRHACVAASTVDALVDFSGWNPHQALSAQKKFIAALGGLRSRGTSLEDAGRTAKKLFGRIAHFEVSHIDFLEDAVQWASMGHGVVVGLANSIGHNEGHAIRILAGDFPQPDPFASIPTWLRSAVMPTKAMNVMGNVQLFDPSPGPDQLPTLVSYGYLRARFDSFGGHALLITQR